MSSIRRIAKLAGVSPAAASMALRDHPRIPEATRRRVRAVAKRAGYKANAKVAELMGQIRAGSHPKIEACLGIISFHKTERPWTESQHLTRMYEGMRTRADALGYRLEPLWLRAPGNSPRRLRTILDARGIEGLLCFGSPNIGEQFPAEFDHFAIVTQGISIKTRLHRILNHAYTDTWHALDKAYARGYRRPGLILGQYEDERGAHANVSAYFGWCENTFGVPAPIPILRVGQVEEEPLLAWFQQHRPDVVIFVHVPAMLAELSGFLRKHRIQVPQDLGVIAISQLLKGTDFSGLEENQPLMGAWAVELLISRIMNRDLGIPVHPRIEMVESLWVEGKSLRAPPRPG